MRLLFKFKIVMVFLLPAVSEKLNCRRITFCGYTNSSSWSDTISPRSSKRRRLDWKVSTAAFQPSSLPPLTVGITSIHPLNQRSEQRRQSVRLCFQRKVVFRNIKRNDGRHKKILTTAETVKTGHNNGHKSKALTKSRVKNIWSLYSFQQMECTWQNRRAIIK